MMKSQLGTIGLVAIIAVVTVATIIVAQEQEKISLVKAMTAAGRSDLQIVVAKADADYSRRVTFSGNRLDILRCRSLIARCKKSITALERVVAAATKNGENVEAAMAKGKIATVREYLAKAEADMPKGAVKPKVASIKLVNTKGVRMKFGGHSYLVILRSTTWNEANRMAKAYKGHLASVGSYREFMFLKMVLLLDSWVGGEPGGQPVQWQWQDGKKIIDAFWKKKMPDVRSGYRVVMGEEGLKIDGVKDYRDAFVIEWDR
jgi:hypothetical protein